MLRASRGAKLAARHGSPDGDPQIGSEALGVNAPIVVAAQERDVLAFDDRTALLPVS